MNLPLQYAGFGQPHRDLTGLAACQRFDAALDHLTEAMAVQSLERLLDPNDIAALAVFLASDAAKSISGQMLPIDNDMQAEDLTCVVRRATAA